MMLADVLYSIDWPTFVQMWVAGIRQRPKHTKFILVLLHPVKVLHNAFLEFRTQSLYKVNHNGSVGSLEAVLNDHFDENQRRIYIQNVQRAEDLKLYSFAEEKEIAVRVNSPVGIRTGMMFNLDAPDFIVYLPTDITLDNQILQEGLVIRIKAQLDYYKKYSKNYKLEWIY